MAAATKDAVLGSAVDLAREVAVELAQDPSDVGEYLGLVVEGERLVSHRFASTARGYRGWEWTVTVARVPRGRTATVCEAELLPGPDAVLGQAWLPWSERIRPGDIGPGDVLPFRADDPRLEPGWTPTGDPELDSVAIDELSLARVRVLSPEGRDEAAERWYRGAHGPTSAGAVASAAACQSCGFLVPLQGSLRTVFGVCANEWSPDDGMVVSLDHGCGAHSETDAESLPTEWPSPDPVVDELKLELVPVAEPAPETEAETETGTAPITDEVVVDTVVSEPSVPPTTADAADDDADVTVVGILAPEPTAAPADGVAAETAAAEPTSDDSAVATVETPAATEPTADDAAVGAVEATSPESAPDPTADDAVDVVVDTDLGTDLGTDLDDSIPTRVVTADAFGTAALRAAVLGAWRASPARLREDANTEEDHARGYYRDRVLVELAQNAADAAVRADVPGRLLLRLDRADDGALVLVAANTGEPLDADGVASLSSMRASSKRGDLRAGGRVVGRFGVGFAAVRAVSDEISLLSTTGGVRFSKRDAAGLLAETSADNPALADEVRRRDGSLPALRLPFPASGRPPAGYDTAVVLELRDEVAADEVRGLLRDVGDPLLLALPGLVEILVEDNTSDAPNRRLADVRERWFVRSAQGELALDLLADRPVEERGARTWRVTWAVPRDESGWTRVIHAPTPTDEPCSVPALLVATLPLDPTRRRVAAGPLTDAVLDHAADTYARLAHDRALAGSAGDVLALVPMGLASGSLDGALRERIIDRLSRTLLLARASGAFMDPDVTGGRAGVGQAAGGQAARGSAARESGAGGSGAGGSGAGESAASERASAGGAGGDVVDRRAVGRIELDAAAQVAESAQIPGQLDHLLLAPSRAVMLAGPAGRQVGAVAELGRRIGGLVVVPAGREAQARVLGVEARGLADVIEELPAVADDDWATLYDAVAPLADDPQDREALGALPVPLADGRVVRGARGLVLLDADVADAVGADALRVLGRWGLRVVDPQAAHPLLARLGADDPDARGLLQHPAVRAAVLEQADDDDLQLADEVTDAVLCVVRAVVGDAVPGAVVDTGAAPWLGLLTLAAADGEPTPAHGLVLPGGTAAALLDARVLAPVSLEAVERWGSSTLVAAGVRDELAVVRLADVVAEPASVDPDGSDDASLAAQSLDGWPEYLDHLSAALGPGEYVGDAVAVADLDAVDPDRWHELLVRLASEPRLRRALLDPVRGERGSTASSYTAWWLRERGPAGLGGIFAVDDTSDDTADEPADDLADDVLDDPSDDPPGVLDDPSGAFADATGGSVFAADGGSSRSTSPGRPSPGPIAAPAQAAALRGLLPSVPDVLRGLDAAVQVALGGVAGLDDLAPQDWARVLDALGPAGTPVEPSVAVALWRGISAAAVRLDDAGATSRHLGESAERLPAIVAPGRVAIVHADDAAVADQPMWWQRTDVAALVPSTHTRADAVARLLDVPAVTDLAVGHVDRPQDGIVTTVPAQVAAVLPGAPATWVEHEELTVDRAPVDWWVTGSGPSAVVRTVHVAGLAAGLAQAAGRWWARSAVEAVLVAPERAVELALDAALRD